ncbi:MAG: DUF1207 domain-containing protein [FCB group bacterium]|nr:DUF1207 domain-containing protein [FCB group bacterium]MBL7027900.1 DUF1207 domain-containing protein [Candidatus Neomarinimicrobiota bacterium]MBL7121909.1 DUF1207 domain-containing protein [Candidatus Neomarinimicrobiota bacterium]
MHIRVLVVLLSIASAGSLSGFQINWLPQGSFFPSRYLDPAAGQQSISVLSYEVAGETQQLMYVPISLSMHQQFVRSVQSETRQWELGMEFTIYSQFSIVDVGEAFMGGLQNADYRISSVFHYQHNSVSLYRVSLFHQSSHLGDDYIIRNFVVTPTLRTQNYEQLDFTLYKKLDGWNLYGVAGYNVSPNTVRKRLLLQLGGDWHHPLSNQPGLALVAGMDVKIYEHNKYVPNVRIATGIEFARRTQTPVKLLLSYYQGHLPYSTLEFQKVRLVGLSLIFDFPRNTK